jgi:hypothetical protein
MSDMDSYQEHISPRLSSIPSDPPVQTFVEEDGVKSPFEYKMQQNIYVVPEQSPGSILDPTSSLESIPADDQLINVGRISQEEPITIIKKEGGGIKKNAASKLSV